MSSQCVSVIIRANDEYSPDNKITLPGNVYKKINRYYGLRLKAGDSEFEVKYSRNDTDNTVELPQNLIEELGLCHNSTVNLFIRSNKIFLGPLIGIFVSNGQIKKANAQNPVFRFIETMKANREAKAVIYYFSINDVNFERSKIMGTWFNEERGQWEKKNFPYPDVLYDRGGGTLESQQLISNYIRDEINKKKSILNVNPRYLFNKWEVHRNLMRYDEMGMYLPPTFLFTSEEDLVRMLGRYPVIYVKDTLGNNGKGVARVKKVSEVEYEISHFFGTTFKYRFNSLEELFKKFNEIFENKEVILQAAIDVLQVNNGNVDMRATVQRDGNGELRITALPVRRGKEECPITTTRSGSTVYKFEDFFKKHYSYSDEEILSLKERVRYFLIRCYMVIEDIYGQFGEIGIDYAIDKEQRIWFIECNAKPGKDTLYLSYDDSTIRKAFLNPLEYSKYLWSNY